MKLFYYHDPKGNFGDDMNAWFWDALMPDWRTWGDDTTLIGIGTVLNTELDLPQGRKLVIGSGTGYGELPDVSDRTEWDVRSVRGPLSASRLGIDPALGIVDPAMLLPRLDQFRDIPKTGTAPLLIPHVSATTRHNWDAVCGRAGLRYVSPSDDAQTVIREIAAAPLVLAESMHAAIIADAFRTPWIAISISGLLNKPKWADWAASLEIDLDVHEMFPEFPAARRQFRALKSMLRGRAESREQGSGPAPARTESPAARAARLDTRVRIERALLVSRLKRAAAQTPTLSDPAMLNARQEAYLAVLDAVRRDYAG